MAIVQRRALERLGAGGHSRPDPSSGYDALQRSTFPGDESRDARGWRDRSSLPRRCWPAVPAASAGTYDVVSCGAPGAGGVNRAWRPEFGGFPPQRRRRIRAPTSVLDQCPAQLFISSAPPDGTTAPFLTSGNWVFDAPCRHPPDTTRDVALRRQAAHEPKRPGPRDRGRPGRPLAGVGARRGRAAHRRRVRRELLRARRGHRLLLRGRLGDERSVARRLWHQRGEDRLLRVVRDARRLLPDLQ